MLILKGVEWDLDDLMSSLLYDILIKVILVNQSVPGKKKTKKNPWKNQAWRMNHDESKGSLASLY